MVRRGDQPAKQRTVRAAARARKVRRQATQKGKWTKGALQLQVVERREAQARVAEAVAFAMQHGYGPRKALRLGKFERISKGRLQNALERAKQSKEDARRNRRYNAILTEDEEAALVQWIIASARNMNAVNERQSGDISEQVIKMLRARKADNRRRKYNASCTPLTRAEQRLLQPNASLSHVYC
eukprot:2581973-Pleurochrysis_carterae.AAC.1